MSQIIAVKTLCAIEQAIKADQGASYRGWLGKIIPHIGDAYRTDEFPFRTHLGASMVGADCARAIWYGFRWVTKPEFDGRLLRLFNRGHLEEARFIAILQTIGCTVYQQDEHGNQFRISDAGGHFGGSGDGVVLGVPDLAPGTPALCEFKTSADKGFQQLKKEGVRNAKFEHFIQMQSYMRKMGLAVALYMVVNKNNDELYAELVYFDATIADEYINRGVQLVWLPQAPKKLHPSPGYWACKFCDHKPVCHMGAKPHKNCRTCRHAKPMEDGTWKCSNFVSEKHGTIDKYAQLEACDKYEGFL